MFKIYETDKKVKVIDKRHKHSRFREEVIYVDNNKVEYLELNGLFTNRGAESWFYKLDRFEEKYNIIYIPEYIGNPDLKLYNNEIKILED